MPTTVLSAEDIENKRDSALDLMLPTSYKRKIKEKGQIVSDNPYHPMWAERAYLRRRHLS